MSFDINNKAIQNGYNYSKAMETLKEQALDFASRNKLDTATKNHAGKKFQDWDDIDTFVTKEMSDSGNYAKVRYGMALHQVEKNFDKKDTIYLKENAEKNQYDLADSKQYDEMITPFMAYALKGTVVSSMHQENAKPFGTKGKSMKGFIMPLRDKVQSKIRKPYSRFITEVKGIIADYNDIERPKDSDIDQINKLVNSLYKKLSKYGAHEDNKILMSMSTKFLKNVNRS